MATAHYPSTKQQSNISFDTYYGKLLDPLCYKILHYLENNLGTDEPLHNKVYQVILENIKSYIVKNSKIQNKSHFKQASYIIMVDCLNKLKKANKPLSQIMNPKNIYDYLLLKTQLMTFLDLWVEFHKESENYNSFAHDYILNNEIDPLLPELYIITNITNPTIKIEKINPTSIGEFLKDREINFGITGCMFLNHHVKEGISTKFLKDRLDMRKEFKRLRNEIGKEHGEGHKLYKFYNHRQDVAKRNCNSDYGITGLPSFRYSNRDLAKATTIGAVMTLKIAQCIAEIYLSNKEKEMKK